MRHGGIESGEDWPDCGNVVDDEKANPQESILHLYILLSSDRLVSHILEHFFKFTSREYWLGVFFTPIYLYTEFSLD